MGNITIGNGTKTITIRGSGSGLVISTSTPTLPIVTTMELTYQLTGGQWLFSLNGVTQGVKDLLDSGYAMDVQLIRNRGYGAITGKTGYYTPGRSKPKPTFPNQIRDEYPGLIRINSFDSSLYTNMNLTSWVNGLISKLSVIRSRSSGNGSEVNFKANTGYWFTQIKFCILINNAFISTTNNNYITLNFYNNNNQSINTNYSLVSNVINIYSA
jgi:hypothetical protein